MVFEHSGATAIKLLHVSGVSGSAVLTTAAPLCSQQDTAVGSQWIVWNEVDGAPNIVIQYAKPGSSFLASDREELTLPMLVKLLSRLD